MASHYIGIPKGIKERGQMKRVSSLSSSRTSGIALDDFTENESASINRDRKDQTVSVDDTTEGFNIDNDGPDTDIDSKLAFDSFAETKRPKLKSHHLEEKCLKCCRIFIYILTFIVVVVSGVISKLNVLKIISDFNQSSGHQKFTYTIYQLILICIYPAMSLLSSTCKILFGNIPSLSKKIILVLMFIDSLHTVGVLSLVFIVLPDLSPASSVNILGFLPIVPALLSCVRTICCAHGKFKRRVAAGLFYFVITSLQIGCFTWLYISDTIGNSSNSTSLWLAPLSVFFVSFAWWENFIDIKLPTSLRTSKSSTTLQDDLNKSRDKVIVFTSISRLSTVGVCVLLVTYNVLPVTISGFDSKNESSTLTTPTNTSSACNITFPTNATASFNNSCPTETIASSDNEINEFDDYGPSNESITPQNKIDDHSKSTSETVYDFLILHFIVPLTIALTFLMCYCSTLACKLHMQRFSFSLATLLISPLAFLFISLHCFNHLPEELSFLVPGQSCLSWTSDKHSQEIIFALLWFSTCLLTYYIWIPKSDRMAKIDSMFTSPLKDSILLDYNLLLRRKNDHKTKPQTSDTGHQRVIPQLYVCATMWHENRQEMFQLLKSLLRLDRHCALSRAAEGIGLVKTVDPDLFETEIHVVFDDAFDVDNERNQEIPNMYVNQFIDCLDEAATAVLGSDIKKEWNNKPISCIMSYGGRLTWTLPGKTKMVIHMKNKNKIRRGKRWSQIMYLYYLLGFKSFEYKDETSVLINKTHYENEERRHKYSYINHLSLSDKTKFQNTFILTLDGDVDFKPSSVIRLIDRMKKNDQVGAVCGRIHPIGSGPVVWYQKFEYAIGHWLQKASEHVLGCVLCCPGCFSLFRASALADNNVMKTYTKKPTEALHYIQFEQGEDRWLCTLLLQQGYKIDYCAGADAKTFAPESFNEFFIQRRRWAPSTLANIFDLLLSWKYTIKQNADISRLFFAYQTMLMAICLLAPATVTLMIFGSLMVVLSLNTWGAFILSVGPIAFYIFTCMKLSGNVQLMSAGVLSAIYSVVMMVVTVGTIISVSWGSFPSPSAWFLGFVILIFILAALLHPREIGCLLHGVLYYITVPSTFVFLTTYYMCNLHIVKWGTRDTKPVPQTNHKDNSSNANSMKSLLKQVKGKLLGNVNAAQTSENTQARFVDTKSDTENKESPNIHNETNTARDLTNFDWTCLDTFFHFQKDNETPRHEEKFWNRILTKYLKPVDKDPQSEQRIKEDLIDLRNKVVFGLFMLNFLFLITLLQLQLNQDLLTGFYILGKYEPVSMIFLGVFTLVLGLQFLSMLVHRWSTFQHLISSTSILSCSGLNEKEKFQINYETVKQAVVSNQSPDFDNVSHDDMNDVNGGTDDNNGFNIGNNTSNKHRKFGGSYRRASNVYASMVQKNFGRTLERQCSRENPGTWRLPVPSFGRSKHKYMSTLRRKYFQSNDNPV